MNPQVDKDNIEAIGTLMCAFMWYLAFMLTATFAELAYMIWQDRKGQANE
jgi:hypothetical protein